MKKSLLAVSFLAMFVLVVAATVMSMPSFATQPMSISVVSQNFGDVAHTKYPFVNNNPSAKLSEWNKTWTAGNYIVVHETLWSLEAIQEIKTKATNSALAFKAKYEHTPAYAAMVKSVEQTDSTLNPISDEAADGIYEVSKEYLGLSVDLFPDFLKARSEQLRVYSATNPEDTFTIPLLSDGLSKAVNVSVSSTGITWQEMSEGGEGSPHAYVIYYLDFRTKEQHRVAEFPIDAGLVIKTEYHAVGIRLNASDLSAKFFRYDTKTRKLVELTPPQSTNKHATTYLGSVTEFQPTLGSHYTAWLADEPQKKSRVILQDVNSAKKNEVQLPFELYTGIALIDWQNLIAIYGENMYISHTTEKVTEIWRYQLGTKKMQKLATLALPNYPLKFTFVDDTSLVLADSAKTYVYSIPKKSVIAEIPHEGSFGTFGSELVGATHGKLVFKVRSETIEPLTYPSKFDPVENIIYSLEKIVNEVPSFTLESVDLPK